MDTDKLKALVKACRQPTRDMLPVLVLADFLAENRLTEYEKDLRENVNQYLKYEGKVLYGWMYIAMIGNILDSVEYYANLGNYNAET